MIPAYAASVMDWIRIAANNLNPIVQQLNNSTLTLTEIDAASVPTPLPGTQNLFIDSADHKLKRKDSSGTVTAIA